MPFAGRMALAVVAGGIALGAMLGAAANPVMKKPPEQPWQGALQGPVAADPGYRLVVEAPPEDLSPYQDSFAPTWAREELAHWEPDYPAWTYSQLADATSADPHAPEEPQADEQPAALAIETPAPSEPVPQPAEPVVLAAQPYVSGSLAGLY